MKILLLGNTGQVGWELNRTLLTLGNLVALDFPQINMADPDNIRAIVHEHRPNIIVNATAYTDVDKAESQPELAMAINGIGPGILAEEAKSLNAALIHYSTDYVFDGIKDEPYSEEDEPNPISIYGVTKLAGEKAVQDVGGACLTFRTSWVYSLRRPSFMTKVLQWAQKYETLRIVDDQISNPTWARSLAEATGQVIAQGKSDSVTYIKEKRGLYHLANAGFCSRFEWAQFVLAHLLDNQTYICRSLERAKSDEFPTPATRPAHSVLDLRKVQTEFHLCLPEWQDAMRLLLDQLQ